MSGAAGVAQRVAVHTSTSLDTLGGPEGLFCSAACCSPTGFDAESVAEATDVRVDAIQVAHSKQRFSENLEVTSARPDYRTAAWLAR